MSTASVAPSSSPNENFIFKCAQYASNITEKLKKFYEEKDFFDTVLLVGKDCIKMPAHKIILSALSEYFWEILHGSPIISKNNEVPLMEIEASTLKPILDYMYSGSIELSVEKIEVVLRSAIFLKMQDLVDGCCDFVTKILNSRNCLYWLRLAKQLSLSGLEEKSSNLVFNNLKEVTKQSEFLLLNETEVKDLLFNDNPYTNFEEELFLSLVTWIEYDKVNRQHLSLELFSMVRYQFLTPKFIIKNSSWICNTVMVEWLDYHMSPESRTSEQQTVNLTSKPLKEENLKQEVAKVSVIGFNDDNEPEIRSYNATLKNWSLEKRGRPPLNSRLDYSMIVIDQKLYVVGGVIETQTTKEVISLDLNTFNWADLPEMIYPQCQCQVVNLNGQLCAFISGNGFIQIFNFSTRTWDSLTLVSPPSRGSKIVAMNGVLYIFDFHYGCVQCYDASSKQWISKSQPIDDDFNSSSIVAVGNVVYGIFVYNKNKVGIIVKCFDISTETWQAVTKIPYSKPLSIKTSAVVGRSIVFQKEDNDISQLNLDTNELTTFEAPWPKLLILPLRS